MGKTKAVYPFVCEKCKAAPARKSGFHRQYRWKTEKGFREHKCYTGNPETARKRAETRARNEETRRRDEKATYDALLQARIAASKYRAGDNVHVAVYVVTRPTHKTNGWGRSVRIRYEEERRYEARTVTIECVTLHGYRGGGFEFRDEHVFPTLAEAERAAAARGADYKEQCKLAEWCR